ncbi:hypothetical protein B0T17DRAFT_617087 [Bombardia bombarda]|uniref:Transcriptional regulator n=1 Tax=Bombardia bombarda TaxID=252184 RepID=A0AA40C4Y8_9PEZI|nr:hypothetical protein B0T17DRAFT_617087 [Bombardia bombarda]
MAPKKVSGKKIETELSNTVRHIYKTTPDDLTVNYVRLAVEKQLKLEDGFLKKGNWKGKSKEIILKVINEIETAEPTASQVSAQLTQTNPESEPELAPKPTPKNAANTRKKRAKKEETPPTVAESDLSDIDDLSEVSEEPPKKRAATTKKGNKRKAISDDEDEDDDEESILSSLSEPEEPPKKKAKATPAKSKAKANAAKPKPKAPKRASLPKKVADSEEESLLSELDEEDFEEPIATDDDSDLSDLADVSPKPVPKPTAKSAAKIVSDDDETGLSEINAEPSEPSVQDTIESKPVSVPVDDDESEMSVVFDEPPKRKRRSKGATVKATTTKDTTKTKRRSTNAAGDDDESEMSDVIDEPPKRKRRTTKEPAAAKGARKPKAASKSASAELSPDEAQIKQLQGYLLKCGIRKIWAFELKKYGDDNKAKIKHLRDLLTEVGMVGRFSESRAKEIKERRELLADLDAVKEGEKTWGLNSGRPSRRRAAPTKIKDISSEDGGGEGGEGGDGGGKKEGDNAADEDGSDDEDAQPRVRGAAKLRADFAFLGDESDSD